MSEPGEGREATPVPGLGVVAPGRPFPSSPSSRVYTGVTPVADIWRLLLWPRAWSESLFTTDSNPMRKCHCQLYLTGGETEGWRG